MDTENIWEQVESGEMPKWFYLYPMHLSARLSDADKTVLKSWVEAEKAKAKAKGEGEGKGKGMDKGEGK